ncbi:uncharacterized protein LOC121742098 [Salvia splendens]|uniref:uncharacterized protein LOC121742098 n=1 Tax=Salvia splendens TaxID=180675 RepID=UPI001C263AFC|nr:uncharacterized protein LOC121742098 [Salvia splendens]
MNSLFSFVTTLYTLLLLYFPSHFYRFLLSPALFSTLILLLYLLRLGAAQRSTHSDSTQPLTEEFRESRGKFRSDGSDEKKETSHLCAESFVEWDVRAPLEVIYEEYEGEDDNSESQMDSIRRYASLSLFYPESDSDASWEGDFAAWDGEGLIEITLDEKRRSCDFEDDNLIEINLSPER